LILAGGGGGGGGGGGTSVISMAGGGGGGGGGGMDFFDCWARPAWLSKSIPTTSKVDIFFILMFRPKMQNRIFCTKNSR